MPAHQVPQPTSNLVPHDCRANFLTHYEANERGARIVTPDEQMP
jgi:hypothetical protein